MAKIQFEVEIDFEVTNEEVNELAASLCLFFSSRTRGFKFLTSRILDGRNTSSEFSSLSYDP